MVRWSASTSCGPSAVVGSSRSSTFGSVTSALATSKSWRSARVSDPGRGVGEQLEVQVELRQHPSRPSLPPPVRRPLVGRGRQVEVVLDRLRQDQRRVLVGHRQAQLARLRGGVAPEASRPRSGPCPDRGPRTRWRSRGGSTCRSRSRRRAACTSPARQSKLTSVSARTAPNCRETPAARGRGPRSPTLLRDRSSLIRSGTSRQHVVRHERRARHRGCHPVRVAVRRGDLPHHVRDDDLAGDLRALQMHHRGGDGRP